MDKANDAGYAVNMKYQNLAPLSHDTLNGWLLSNQLSYEYSGKNFRPVERYRNVEFERDWNLGTATIINDEPLKIKIAEQIIEEYAKKWSTDGLKNDNNKLDATPFLEIDYIVVLKDDAKYKMLLESFEKKGISVRR